MKLLTCLCSALVTALLATAASADPAPRDVSPSEIVSALQLTDIFKTRTQWDVVVSRDNQGDTALFDPPFFHLCFNHNEEKQCVEGTHNISMNIFVVYSGYSKIPILTMRGSYNPGGSAAPTDTIVWAYNPVEDRFEKIFDKASNLSVNEEARVIPKGPLAGEIIVATPTDRYPFPYDITVYEISRKERYDRTLHYAGHTTYGDGNTLAVIDSEMPEIERRLHIWKPGDALPRPLYLPTASIRESLPDRCVTFEMRNGTEWCR